MLYFVNQTIPERLTGIESAQLKRLRMLADHHVEAQLVTVAYSPLYAQNMPLYQLRPENVVNMYDYLCGIDTQTGKPVKTEQLRLPAGLTARPQGTELHYYNEQGQFMVKVKLNAAGAVLSVNYYGKNKQAVRSEIYDIRGFKSSEIWYDRQLRSVQRFFFNPSGELKMIFFYRMGQLSQQTVRAVQYYAPDGRWLHFASEGELASYFLDQLNQRTERNLFVSDRTARVGWSIAHMRTRAFKLFHVHSTQVNTITNLQSDDFNSNYRYAFKNLGQWNGMIASTHAQVADLQKKFPETTVYRASVSIIPDQILQALQVGYDQRTPFKIIAVARLNPEKRLDQIVRIFALIHAQIPQATLDIWGFVADQKVKKQLMDLVAELNLTAAVQLKGYAVEMRPIYDQAQFLMVTSRYEGTALVIAEALAHGVPVISYDFNYGPREFIDSGENGYIVPVDDQAAAAKVAITALNDPDQWQRLSQAAYRSSSRSSEEASFASWQTIIAATEAFYREDEN